ncbi:MAG: pseudouridine synthase [Candidatus Paceibacterota bacterium]
MNKSDFPVRINKYLKDMGVASRRKADEIVRRGHVTINGKTATLGELVHENDEVAVDSVFLKNMSERLYVLFNKPIGIVSHNPISGQKEVADLLPDHLKNKELAVLGRLDRASHGLMLLSNNGLIVDKLLNPKSHHEKEYVVELDKPVTNFFLKRMKEGVHLQGGLTSRKTKVETISDTTIRITLTEGKKHQIRRMTDSLSFAVRDLKRIRIGSLTLGNLKEGEFRVLEGQEKADFLSSLN